MHEVTISFESGDVQGFKCDAYELTEGWVTLWMTELIPYNWGDDKSRPQKKRAVSKSFRTRDVLRVTSVGDEEI